ncbi:hypothetical protein RR45_GL001377 [Lactococcus chungangensis CAU 28 = DSM 22330]|uniref:Uncharacterized protein n=1 Tax=Pseudolactococcus chungangensis CAU 28 = DSM 22330 TaxID=1122154 RepID=A0ABX4I4K4_9LACT|nr:hypothetical protein RR45_GL001377 [Lactococcus chungangensis CAU 28 = DSM 22330]
MTEKEDKPMLKSRAEQSRAEQSRALCLSFVMLFFQRYIITEPC